MCTLTYVNEGESLVLLSITYHSIFNTQKSSSFNPKELHILLKFNDLIHTYLSSELRVLHFTTQPAINYRTFHWTSYTMSRYAEAHKSTKGAGDARPTAMQIVEDEGLIGKLSDKVFMITGVSSGIGIETLRALHATGATVYGTVRNAAKGQKVVDEILASDPGNKAAIHLLEFDLGSLDSVRKGAAEFLKQSQQLNILVNNAGVSVCPFLSRFTI